MNGHELYRTQHMQVPPEAAAIHPPSQHLAVRPGQEVIQWQPFAPQLEPGLGIYNKVVIDLQERAHQKALADQEAARQRAAQATNGQSLPRPMPQPRLSPEGFITAAATAGEIPPHVQQNLARRTNGRPVSPPPAHAAAKRAEGALFAPQPPDRPVHHPADSSGNAEPSKQDPRWSALTKWGRAHAAAAATSGTASPTPPSEVVTGNVIIKNGRPTERPLYAGGNSAVIFGTPPGCQSEEAGGQARRKRVPHEPMPVTPTPTIAPSQHFINSDSGADNLRLLLEALQDLNTGSEATHSSDNNGNGKMTGAIPEIAEPLVAAAEVAKEINNDLTALVNGETPGRMASPEGPAMPPEDPWWNRPEYRIDESQEAPSEQGTGASTTDTAAEPANDTPEQLALPPAPELPALAAAYPVLAIEAAPQDSAKLETEPGLSLLGAPDRPSPQASAPERHPVSAHQVVRTAGELALSGRTLDAANRTRGHRRALALGAGAVVVAAASRYLRRR